MVLTIILSIVFVIILILLLTDFIVFKNKVYKYEYLNQYKRDFKIITKEVYDTRSTIYHSEKPLLIAQDSYLNNFYKISRTPIATYEAKKHVRKGAKFLGFIEILLFIISFLLLALSIAFFTLKECKIEYDFGTEGDFIYNGRLFFEELNTLVGFGYLFIAMIVLLIIHSSKKRIYLANMENYILYANELSYKELLEPKIIEVK